MSVLFKNNAHSTLAAGISDSATSITLATGHGNARFPATSSPDYFYATLIDSSNNLEVVKCTNRSADVLTVVREQESTTGRAFVLGDRIEIRITAQGLTDLNSTITITDNESTNEDNALVFTSGGDVDGGNLGLESDGTLTYNPSTGKITATGFIGALTGNASGSSATCSGLAATATALASARNIGGVSFDGTGNIDLPGVNAAGSQNTSGTAAGLSATLVTGSGGTGLTGNVVGKQTMWIPAAAMYPNTTSGCAALAQVELSNGPEIKVLDFDTSSDEHAQFTVAFPKLWNEGTVTFQAFFTVTGTNAGTVAWGLSGVAFADNGDQNTAFGTNVVATAKAHSGTSNDLDVSAESGAVTIAGSPGVDELVYFQIMRDVSADDQSGDARLLGIKLFFTTDALTDT